MRVWGAVLLGLAVVTTAEAQVLTVGAAGTITMEINPASRPGASTLSNNTITPSLFIGFPIEKDTIIRLQVVDLPHEQVVGNQVIDSRLRGVTVGVDYLMVSTFGRAVFSGGLGGYKLNLQGSNPPPGVESWDFGWYVGIGEWFPMSRRTQLTMELSYHNTTHSDKPQILSLAVGLAYTF
jgi:hypothetical protein